MSAAAFAFIGLLLMLVFSASPCEAQEAGPLVDSLIEINERAAEQARLGNHAEAAELFRASLLLEELDISYLNLGRALALAGRCEEARVAYAQALVAPPCGDPAPEEVARTVERYRAELPLSCDGLLYVQCSAPETLLSLDGGPLQRCSDEALRVGRGVHRLDAQAPWGASLGFEFELAGLEVRTLAVDFPPAPPPERVVEERRVPVTQPPSWTSPSLWGGVASGLGASMLVSALVVEWLLIDPVYDEYRRAAREGDRETYEALRGPIDSMQPVNQTLVIGGAILLAGGATLVTLDLMGVFDERPNLASAWVGPTEAGLMWQCQW